MIVESRAVPRPRQPTTEVPMPTANGSDRKPLILSIDDDPNIHRLVELYLKKEGCDVVLACSGSEGLSRVKELVPDLILLDVEMPG